MLLAALLVVAPAAETGDLIVRTDEPAPAMPWTLTFEASCPGTTLRIEGYGPSRPIGRQTRILVNGEPLQSGEATVLARELSNPRAVYRFQALCNAHAKSLQLRISSGEKKSDRSIEYRAGSVDVSPGKFAYRPFEVSDARSFWFR
jgi:hypothetical protein